MSSSRAPHTCRSNSTPDKNDNNDNGKTAANPFEKKKKIYKKKQNPNSIILDELQLLIQPIHQPIALVWPTQAIHRDLQISTILSHHSHATKTKKQKMYSEYKQKKRKN